MSNSPGRPPCGAHVELSKRGAVRVTRCACGAVHLHLARPGVTVQIAPEQLSDLAAVCAEAARDVASADQVVRFGGDPCAN